MSYSHRYGPLLAVIVSVALPATSQAYSPPGNRLTTPGAENQALAGWAGSGWTSAGYGEPGRPPVDEPARLHYGDGVRLFVAAGASATITQTLDVSDLAARIDAADDLSRPYFSFGGDFGGGGEQPDTARISVQPLDAGGGVVGLTATVGGPTARDRGNQTTLLNCLGLMRVPAGTRALRVTLNATGPAAMADALFVVDYAVVRPAVDTGTITADGAGCESRVKRPDFTGGGSGSTGNSVVRRVPKLTSLLSLPAARRCGKSSRLRLRVAQAWRAKVKSVQVEVRGKGRTMKPTSTMTFAGPTRTLLARFTVTLADGRVRTGQRRFRACRSR